MLLFFLLHSLEQMLHQMMEVNHLLLELKKIHIVMLKSFMVLLIELYPPSKPNSMKVLKLMILLLKEETLSSTLLLRTLYQLHLQDDMNFDLFLVSVCHVYP